jgi:hypothetical protein
MFILLQFQSYNNLPCFYKLVIQFHICVLQLLYCAIDNLEYIHMEI